MSTIEIILNILLILIGTIFAISLLTNLVTLIPYVPSKQNYILNIIESIKQNKKSGTIYDLGSGDGRVLFTAEKLGFKAVGYEHALVPFLQSYIKKLITKSKVKITFGSFFKGNLNKADVIFVYLLPLIMKKLLQKIQNECKKGTIIISSGFEIEGLNLIKFYKRDKEKNWPCIYYYQV